MREISFWTFIAYYGTLYLVCLVVMTLGYVTGKDAVIPIATAIFGPDFVAKGNSVFKVFWASTLVYWSFILIWELGVQKAKLLDCPWDTKKKDG